MKVASVLDYLKDDIKLVAMLKHTKSKPKITAYKAHDKNDYSYLVVKLEPFLIDTVIGQHRCEVRIVTDDVLSVEKLTDAVINRLHFGNRPSVKQGNNLIYTSIHSGGSLLIDEGKGIYEQVLFFNIKFNR